jgi:hypothetical protein
MYYQKLKRLISAITILMFSQLVFAQTTKIRIGTFDSRLIALAYYGSKDYGKVIADFDKDYKDATLKKDSAVIKKLLVKGPVMQRMMNDRIYGKGTINDILDHYKDKITAIAKSQNVVMAVSKWEVQYKTPGVELIDLTWKIMDIFNPSSQVIQWAKAGEKELPIKDAIFEDIN